MLAAGTGWSPGPEVPAAATSGAGCGRAPPAQALAARRRAGFQ